MLMLMLILPMRAHDLALEAAMVPALAPGPLLAVDAAGGAVALGVPRAAAAVRKRGAGGQKGPARTD
jgi:hypothetical protein